MANAIYLVRGTSLLFADTAQVEDVAITLSALASGAGRVSAAYDRGAGATVGLWSWRLRWSLTGTNIVGAAVEVYCFTSDNAFEDGDVGTADATFATDKRNNAKLAGLAVVDQTTTNVVMHGSGTILIPTRYFSMGIWNATTLPFTTSTSAHGLIMTPLNWEVQ